MRDRFLYYIFVLYYKYHFNDICIIWEKKLILVKFRRNNGKNALSNYFFPQNEPGLVLNLFLNFGKNPGSSSYKLGSYKKKKRVEARASK